MSVDLGYVQDLAAGALAGRRLTVEEATVLLACPPGSPAAETIWEAARELALRHAREGRIWAAIGVDYCPCPQNCSFCSFGEKWGIVRDSHEWSLEQIVAAGKSFAAQGAAFITIRTTQHYPLEQVCGIAEALRAAIPGCPKLVINTGEFSAAEAEQLHAAGYSMAYHVFRMREGVDTGISAKARLATLNVIHRSPLDLAFLAEPVGPEHTPAEIATEMVRARDLDATLMGVMARVPVPGTPKAPLGALTPEQVAHAIAVSRLVAGTVADDICVHPLNELALQAGANAIVVETGAVPRDREEIAREWRGLTMDQAREILGRYYPTVAGTAA
ncbi:MAG: radical SAM protein [Armatimonadetes bacterium]|jgi:biotin synthase|nr:radical SAM protein [Armatimonadota bacterium]